MKYYCLCLSLVFGMIECCSAQEVLESPIPNFDPSGMIRFETTSQAERRRASLNKYIWPQGLPNTRPKVRRLMNAEELKGISPDLIDHVDRFDIRGFHALILGLIPLDGILLEHHAWIT